MLEIPGLSAVVPASRLIVAAAILFGSPLLGWAVQRVVNAALRRRLERWRGRDVLRRAVRSVSLAGFTLAGAFTAAAVLPLRTGVRREVDRALLAILIVVVTMVASRVTTDLVRMLTRRTDESRRSSSIFVNLARFFIGLLGILFLLQNLGVSITPILTALGVGGVAVALALQDTLSNLFAGVQIVATKKVKRGDYVKLETGQEGFVADIDWRHTSIRELPSNMILVPNGMLVNSVITNYHYPQTEMSVLVEVGVAYASDLEQVEEVTIEVARETLREVDGGVGHFDPFVRFHTFNDFSIDFTVILRVREYTDQYLVKHEFLKRLHRAYAQRGIEIPFPVRTVLSAEPGGTEAGA